MAVSLSGLDLSFLKKPNPDSVQRGRFRYDAEDGVVPAHVHARKHRAKDKRSRKVALPYMMPDVDTAYGGAWKSIIDGSTISSRANWREHNKRNGVEQVDPDYWGKTNDDYVTENKARMEFGAETSTEDSVFSWKQPESAKARTNAPRKPGRQRQRKSA